MDCRGVDKRTVAAQAVPTAAATAATAGTAAATTAATTATVAALAPAAAAATGDISLSCSCYSCYSCGTCCCRTTTSTSTTPTSSSIFDRNILQRAYAICEVDVQRQPVAGRQRGRELVQIHRRRCLSPTPQLIYISPIPVCPSCYYFPTCSSCPICCCFPLRRQFFYVDALHLEQLVVLFTAAGCLALVGAEYRHLSGWGVRWVGEGEV